MKIKDYWSKGYTKKAVFILTVFTCAVLIIAILYKSPIILSKCVEFLSWVAHVLTGFIAGFVLAYLLNPVVELLQKTLMKIPFFSEKEKMARGLGIAFTYLLIFALIFAGLMAMVFAVTKQISTIDFAELPKLIRSIQIQANGLKASVIDTLENIGIESKTFEEWLKGVGDSVSGSLFGSATAMSSLAGNVTSFFSNLLFAVIFSVYFMFDTEGLMSYWNKAFQAILGNKAHNTASVLLSDADKCFSGYIRGQFADAAFMAVAISLTLSIAGVPYAIVIGIMTGIGNLIPYVGPFVAYGMTIVVCVASAEWKALAIGLVLIFILQTIDGNVINPRLLSSSIDVHPVLIIVGLLFGSAVGGFMGMLLAVPVASFIKIQFERIIDYLTQKRSKQSPQSNHES